MNNIIAFINLDNDDLKRITNNSSKLIQVDKISIIIPTTPKKYYLYHNDSYLCLILGDVFNRKNPAKYLVDSFNFQKEKSFEALDGRFCALFVDLKNNVNFLFKDKIGLQHGYYTRIGEKYIISTAIREILKNKKQLSNSLPHIDPVGIGYYITFQYLPSPHTIFKHVLQIPRDNIIKITKNNQNLISPIFLQELPIISHTNIPERIKGLLVKSMHQQVDLGNIQGIGAFLSGGIDTSTNIAILTGDLHLKLTAFTASFPGTDYDETADAKLVAHRFNIRHEIIRIVPEMLNKLSEIVALYDNPHGDKSVFAEYFLAREMKKQDITQLVTGEGGDEIFGFPRSRDGNADFYNLPQSNMALSDFYLDLTSVSPRDIRYQLLSSLGLRKKDYGEKYLACMYAKYNQYSPFEKIYFGQRKTWLIEDVFMKDKQIADFYDLRLIVPYIDAEIIDYMSSLSLEEKLAGLHDKFYIKNIMGGILPKVILNKPKHKFWLPFKEWFQKEGREFLEGSLLSNDTQLLTFFDKKVIRNIINIHVKNERDCSRILWALLFLEYWLKDINKADYEKIYDKY